MLYDFSGGFSFLFFAFWQMDETVNVFPTTVLLKCFLLVWVFTCILWSSPQVLEMFILVLQQCHKENEDKWKRLSRQIADIILPMLAKQQVFI